VADSVSEVVEIVTTGNRSSPSAIRSRDPDGLNDRRDHGSGQIARLAVGDAAALLVPDSLEDVAVDRVAVRGRAVGVGFGAAACLQGQDY
jgi:hypothetical protein